MHWYRIVAQISLVFSILNLVLAAPIVVQEIHEARGDEMVVAEGLADMQKKWRELDAASDRSTSPRSSPDAMASPQHPSSSTSSGYPSPYLSSDSSDSGYSWLLDRPPRLSPDLPVSLHESASPHPSSSGSSQIALLEWLQEFAPEIPPSPHPSSSGSSEIPPSPQLTESDRATTETYSPSDRFTPSHHPSSLSTDTLSWQYRNPWFSDESMSTPYSSASGGSLSSHYLLASDGSLSSHYLLASDGSLSSHYLSASDGPVHSLESISGSVPLHHSMQEGFAPSSTPDGSPTSPSSPPTETPPDNAEFFNKNMVKKLKIVAGVVIIGGVIAGIAGSQIKHRD
jgi:hypothetical protein